MSIIGVVPSQVEGMCSPWEAFLSPLSSAASAGPAFRHGQAVCASSQSHICYLCQGASEPSTCTSWAPPYLTQGSVLVIR